MIRCSAILKSSLAALQAPRRTRVGIASELGYHKRLKLLRDAMASLTIRHVTTYRYRKPVAFGEHRLMFRPRDTDVQKVVTAHLAITPQPTSLDFIEDGFGNQIGVARFSGRATELRFESIVDVEHSPRANSRLEGAHAGTFPVTYDEAERPQLLSSMQRHYPDPENAIGIWASGFLPADVPIGNFELLVAMTRGIRAGLRYQRREAKGIQTPQETLLLGQGSCRDFAMLMIEAARSLGFAARFASGYLAASMDNPAGGSTHAWAQVYLPVVGWIDFDPTSGTTGAASVVTVAVVQDPHHALPLHGTYFGSAIDHLGMDVHVRVIGGAPDVMDTKEA
jgi:transglutaminase-like putative cysteine protease